MRTYELITSALERIGIENAYRKFDDIKSGEYVTWYIPRETITGSDDGKHRIRSSDIVIELYMPKKKISIEAEIEAAFAPYTIEKTEDYDETENLYVITYMFTIADKIKNNWRISEWTE